jgi:hypothetical protein
MPHWLKSIDVIDRLITNGGRAHNIAVMVNEFREVPRGDDGVYRPNSVTAMMHYSMNHAVHSNWTIGKHLKFGRVNPNLLETNINVGRFRTPRETHPKKASIGQDPTKIMSNLKAEPVEFKALSFHVKKHPAGDDALDLTRCVRYAEAHSDEVWYFPNDLVALVNKLGGPVPITHAHFDKQVFARRAGPTLTPRAKALGRFGFDDNPESKHESNDHAMPQSRRLKRRATSPVMGSPLKQMTDANGAVQIGGRRTSSRLATKTRINHREYDSDATVGIKSDSTCEWMCSLCLQEKDFLNSPYATPAKKRKLSRIPATPASTSNDSDFAEDISEPDDENPEAEIISDDEYGSPVNAARSRAAARKARAVIRSMSTETERAIESLEKLKGETTGKKAQMPLVQLARAVEISPEMMSLARDFSTDTPSFLKPPILSANRLRIDSSSIFLYAAEGCADIAEMWDSALSSTRFNGPRRHPPFRELHRLTDPPANDVSDWAENVRWAKKQHAVYGSETWTEYDYHLEQITEHRRGNWVSEEAVRASF